MGRLPLSVVVAWRVSAPLTAPSRHDLPLSELPRPVSSTPASARDVRQTRVVMTTSDRQQCAQYRRTTEAEGFKRDCLVSDVGAGWSNIAFH